MPEDKISISIEAVDQASPKMQAVAAEAEKALGRIRGGTAAVAEASQRATLSIRPMNQAVRVLAEAAGSTNPLLATATFHLTHFSQAAGAMGPALGTAAAAMVFLGGSIAARFSEMEELRQRSVDIARALRGMDVEAVSKGMAEFSVALDNASAKEHTFVGRVEETVRAFLGLSGSTDKARAALGDYQAAAANLAPILREIQTSQLSVARATALQALTAGGEAEARARSLGPLPAERISGFAGEQRRLLDTGIAARRAEMQNVAQMEREALITRGDFAGAARRQERLQEELKTLDFIAMAERDKVTTTERAKLTEREKFLVETANFERDLAVKTAEARAAAAKTGFEVFKADAQRLDDFLRSMGVVPLYSAYGPAARAAFEADLAAKTAAINAAAQGQIALLQFSGRTEQEIAQETAIIKANAQQQVNTAIGETDLKLRQVADEDTVRWKANMEKVAEAARAVEEGVIAAAEATDRASAARKLGGALETGIFQGGMEAIGGRGAIGRFQGQLQKEAESELQRVAAENPLARISAEEAAALKRSIVFAEGNAQGIEANIRRRQDRAADLQHSRDLENFAQQQSAALGALPAGFESQAFLFRGAPTTSGTFANVPTARENLAAEERLRRVSPAEQGFIQEQTGGGDLTVNVNIGDDRVADAVVGNWRDRVRFGQVDIGDFGTVGEGID